MAEKLEYDSQLQHQSLIWICTKRASRLWSRPAHEGSKFDVKLQLEVTNPSGHYPKRVLYYLLDILIKMKIEYQENLSSFSISLTLYQ